MIFDKLVEIFERVMPQVNTADITMDSVLSTDLGVDSLNMMLLAISVEDAFDINFESSVRLETVKDICDYVASKTAA